MLDLLTNSFLTPKDAAFYDLKAKSHQELLANFHAKVNECVKEINDFTESMSKKYDDFLAADETSKQEHMTAIRQEFQDFIDVINLKMLEIENHLSDQDKEVQDAVSYMVTNLRVNVNSIIQGMKESGELHDEILVALDNVKNEFESEITRLDGEITRLDGEINTVESIAKGRNRAHVFGTTDDMYTALSNVGNKGLWNVGDNLYIVAIDVPDWWISEVLEEPDEDGRYYKVAQLETQKVDLSTYDEFINNLKRKFKTLQSSSETGGSPILEINGNICVLQYTNVDWCAEQIIPSEYRPYFENGVWSCVSSGSSDGEYRINVCKNGSILLQKDGVNCTNPVNIRGQLMWII